MLAELQRQLAASGHAFVPAAKMRELIERFGRLDDWQAFAASWNSLPVDEYMADHGRYRRRRHAAYSVDEESAIVRQPAQAHFQSIDYNPLNGGIARWFEPLDAVLGEGSSVYAILACCVSLFGALATDVRRWHVEVHQFRIEAVPGQPALPTPEGMHRDGVDYVLVLLVQRTNIDSGTTMIGTAVDGFSSSFTLAAEFDAALVDDHRVFHGVTAVRAHDPGLPAFRDVLVVTFRRA